MPFLPKASKTSKPVRILKVKGDENGLRGG